MKRYTEHSKKVSETWRAPFWQRTATVDQLQVACGFVVVALVVASYALGASRVLPLDPQKINPELTMAPPGTAGHWLGTDFMGRDILSRLVIGTQAYFLPGLLAIGISLSIGTFLGVAAGYRGGWPDRVCTYIGNLLDSFPRLVLILLMVAALKPDMFTIMVVVGVTNIPAVASLIKNKIVFLKQKNHIEAATALGLSGKSIILKHILWLHCRAVLIIQSIFVMAEAVWVETSVSYLGFGVQEPTPSWGNMVQSGVNYLMQGAFWPSTAPALAILLTILGFRFLGNGLHHILERKADP